MPRKKKATEVVLMEKWLGWPAGSKLNLLDWKADDLISRGVAKPVKAKRTTAPKNRMIKTDGTPVANTG